MKLTISQLFQKNSAEDYIHAAEETARWIQTQEVQEKSGKSWKIFPEGQNGLQGSPFLGKRTLYAGAAGIGLFFLRLYQLTDKEEWLSEAKAAAEYLLSNPLGIDYYKSVQKKIADNAEGVHGWAFSYKVGPISEGQFVYALYKATHDKRYEEFAIKQTDIFVEAAIGDEKGIHWSDCRDIVGDAGGIVYLLQVYRETGNRRYLETAIQAGKYIESFGHKGKHGGTYYDLYDLERAGEGEKGTVHVNFSHGSSGTAYLWAVLYEATRDKHYLDLANDVIRYLDGISIGDENAVLFPYQDHPEKGEADSRFYLGMCGGPIGSSFVFKKLYEVTGDKTYLDWIRKLSRGLTLSGVPERKSWGYWGSKCICCGGPGALEYFASFFQFTGDNFFKDAAERTANVLLGESFEENGGRTWYGAWDRIAPTRVVSYTGFYIGAAGAAGALLKWAAVLQGKPIAEFFEYNL